MYRLFKISSRVRLKPVKLVKYVKPVKQTDSYAIFFNKIIEQRKVTVYKRINTINITKK
jgi:hypothetical protein